MNVIGCEGHGGPEVCAFVLLLLLCVCGEKDPLSQIYTGLQAGTSSVPCFINLLRNQPHLPPMKRWRTETHRQNRLAWILNSSFKKDLGSQKRWEVAALWAETHKRKLLYLPDLSPVPARRGHSQSQACTTAPTESGWGALPLPFSAGPQSLC